MPTIEEVCNTFGLTDVQIEYSDADFQNLTTYKLFQQHVRPLLAKENPKVRVFLYIFVGLVLCIFIGYDSLIISVFECFELGSNVKTHDVGGSQVARFL